MTKRTKKSPSRKSPKRRAKKPSAKRTTKRGSKRGAKRAAKAPAACLTYPEITRLRQLVATVSSKSTKPAKRTGAVRSITKLVKGKRSTCAF